MKARIVEFLTFWQGLEPIIITNVQGNPSAMWAVNTWGAWGKFANFDRSRRLSRKQYEISP